MLHPMRQALERAQAVQQRRARQANRLAQGQRGQRVGGVVQAGELHAGKIQHRLTVHRQPHRLAIAAQAIGGRRIQRKAADVAARTRHGAAEHIVLIEHLHAVAGKNRCLAVRVIQQILIAVEVVFRDIQHRGGVGAQAAHALQLKAGQLQHKRLRPDAAVFDVAQRVQHRQADIAGHHGVQPGVLAQMPHQRGHRGLAVRAGDGDHLAGLPGDGAGKQLHIADHLAASLGKRHDLRRGQGHARTDHQQLAAGKAVDGEGAGAQLGLGGQLRQLGQMRRRRAAVNRHQPRAATRQPAQRRQAAVAQANHADGESVQILHRLLLSYRSFRVDRPASTSIMVMIQKRTTTWVSFQPFNS